MLKVHTIAKNALTMAYASERDGLMRANARLARIGLAGAIAALPFGIVALKAVDPAAPLYLAAVIYAVSAGLAARLPHPGVWVRPQREPGDPDRAPMGRVARLQLPAMGAIGMRAAAGFLLFLLAFALRDAEVPALWFAVVGGAGVVGGFLADAIAPALRTDSSGGGGRDRVALVGAIGALLASQLFGLPLLTVYALSAGAAAEFARLAFQALMQRYAPPEALGRVSSGTRCSSRSRG